MANMSTSVAVLCVLVALQATTTLAGKASGNGKKKMSELAYCKLFDLSITKLEVCPDSMVTFQDFNITLNDNCEIVPSGCVTSKAFETAQITWNITTSARIAKGGHEKMSGEADACKQLENVPEDALAIMKAMQLTTTCPMPEAKECAKQNQTIDMKKFKKFIPLMWLATGNITADINIKYNNGVSCVKFEAALVNKNGTSKRSGPEIEMGKVIATKIAKGLLDKFMKPKKST